MIITGLNYSETMKAMNAVGEGELFSWWPRIDSDPCFDCGWCHQLCHKACQIKGSYLGTLGNSLCSDSCKREFDAWYRPKPEQQFLSFMS